MMTREMKKDFKQALLLLEELYVAFFQKDVLSVADTEDMADLLSKPYVRKMLKGNRYLANPEGRQQVKRALESLDPYPPLKKRYPKKKTDEELVQWFKENRLGELEDYLEENGHLHGLKPRPKTELEKALDEQYKKIGRSKSSATKFLKEVGILDKNGKPSRRFYPELYEKD